MSESDRRFDPRMRVRDVHEEHEPHGWTSLSLQIDAPMKPRFRVEYSPHGLLRFTFDQRPVLWCRWRGGGDLQASIAARRGSASSRRLQPRARFRGCSLSRWAMS